MSANDATEIGAAIALLRAAGYVVQPPDTIDGQSVRWGCHVELHAIDDSFEPDGCVIDDGMPEHCIYARGISCKEQCGYWKPFTAESLRLSRAGATP